MSNAVFAFESCRIYYHSTLPGTAVPKQTNLFRVSDLHFLCTIQQVIGVSSFAALIQITTSTL